MLSNQAGVAMQGIRNSELNGESMQRGATQGKNTSLRRWRTKVCLGLALEMTNELLVRGFLLGFRLRPV